MQCISSNNIFLNYFIVPAETFISIETLVKTPVYASATQYFIQYILKKYQV